MKGGREKGRREGEGDGEENCHKRLVQNHFSERLQVVWSNNVGQTHKYNKS